MNRKAAVAGAFYPAETKNLDNFISGCLISAKNLNLKSIKGLIVPHAGYIYSGKVAAQGYRQLLNLPDNRYNVFLLGPAHFTYTTASIGSFEEFETPLGNVPVNIKICGKLSRNDCFDKSVKSHIPEHSLEVQLPFLIKTLKNFSIVPILLGDISPDIIGKILQPYFEEKENIFIFSSDLSHYSPYNEALDKDRKTLNTITGLDITNEPSIDACGERGIKIAMRMAVKGHYKINLVEYKNSGDTAGDKEAVVGYASLAITK
jgi:MEMO1 family protein